MDRCWQKYCSNCGRKGHPEERCLTKRIKIEEEEGMENNNKVSGTVDKQKMNPDGEPVKLYLLSEEATERGEGEARIPGERTRQNCYNCNKDGHQLKDCPIKVKVCHGCGHQGHVAKNCPLKDKVCYNCGKQGHIAKMCPWKMDRKEPRNIIKVRG